MIAARQNVQAPVLSDEVYEQLRQALIRGEIRPNERMVETDLAERLSASRTPIREALQRLAVEGLVTRYRRGWVAREHTPGEIGQIYEVRTALEGYAARLAAERATDEQLERIMALHQRAGEVAVSPFEFLVNVNEEFHDAITAASGNDRLIELVRRNREYYFNYRIAVLYSDAEASAAVRGHERIIQALRRRDAAAAEQLARDHIQEGLTVLLSKVR